MVVRPSIFYLVHVPICVSIYLSIHVSIYVSMCLLMYIIEYIYIYIYVYICVSQNEVPFFDPKKATLKEKMAPK